MNNQGAIREKIQDYLNQKMRTNRTEEILDCSPTKNNRGSFQSVISENWSHTQTLSSGSYQTFYSSSIDTQWSQQNQSSHKSNSSNCKTATTRKRRLIKVRDIQENVCSICLDQVRQRAELPCRHSYCHECLGEWLKTSSRCPYCRNECDYYFYGGEKYGIEQRQFEYEAPEQEGLDFECYMCQQTNEGDEVLICDQCEMHACHVLCDSRLRPSFRIHFEEDWLCHFCS